MKYESRIFCAVKIRLVACQATQMNKRKADAIVGATPERSLYTVIWHNQVLWMVFEVA